MFKPHVTVACVVHAEGKFLVVEETINGKALWNQPAGHLEADETLVDSAAITTRVRQPAPRLRAG
ncbi:NUDIX domain-containing protein, partial [Escherichia sp. R-CC3]